VLQTRKGSASGRSLEHQLPAFALRNIGGVDHHAEQEAFGIHEDMAFDAHQLLVAVKAAHAAHEGLDRLTVDERRARGGITTGMETGELPQVRMDFGPGPI
jgi:hypothetical protein